MKKLSLGNWLLTLSGVLAQFAINPKFVSGWSLSGIHSGLWSHLEYVEAAKK